MLDLVLCGPISEWSRHMTWPSCGSPHHQSGIRVACGAWYGVFSSFISARIYAKVARESPLFFDARLALEECCKEAFKSAIFL